MLHPDSVASVYMHLHQLTSHQVESWHYDLMMRVCSLTGKDSKEPLR